MAFYKIRPKAGTKSQWEAANTILGEREIGFEYCEEGLAKGEIKMKMGDGATAWNDLPYAIDTSQLTKDVATLKEQMTNIFAGTSTVLIDTDEGSDS